MPFVTPTSGLLVRPAPRKLRAPAFLQNIAERLFGVRGLSRDAILTALGIAAFVDVIILAVDAATVWSVAGYFHLPVPMTLTLALALSLPAAWACWTVVRLALEAERDGAD